jgi:glycosyltransferase involved in cell wall biosynthesis
MVGVQERREISVVVPVYESSDSLVELYNRLVQTLETITESFELIFVNDASTDSGWDLISSLARIDSRVRGIDLSRNFGQHAAISAGLDRAIGKWVVIMDCDLQDQPEAIGVLYSTAMTGFDQVVAIKTERQHSLVKRVTAWAYVVFMSKICGVKINQNIGNFGIYSETVIGQIRSLKEQNLTFGLAAIWVGFNRAEIPIVHAERTHGRTTYTLRKLVSSAISGFTSYSDRPLKLVVTTGFLTAGSATVFGVLILIKQIVNGGATSGWASLMVVLLTMFGVLLAALGIVGLYVGNALQETKGRPKYIVRTETNLDK